MRKYLGGGFVYGVPARDLEEFEWLALTDKQKEAAGGLYKRIRKPKESSGRHQETIILPVTADDPALKTTEVD